MNREQLAALIKAADYTRLGAEALAERLLAAGVTVLPQVTTAAELEALPANSWLIGQISYGGFATYQLVDGMLDDAGVLRPFADVLAKDVLTVVWQPS